jgi:hypothetical protein
MSGFEIKDSGARQEFEGGGVRDTEEGKLDYSNLFVWLEPMGTRYVEHMTAGRKKYPDPEPGVPNWTLFPATPELLARTERSLDRHYKAYRAGKTDEDHAAAIIFNLNLCERTKDALHAQEMGRNRGDDNRPQPAVDFSTGSAVTPTPRFVPPQAAVPTSEARLTVTEGEPDKDRC